MIKINEEELMNFGMSAADSLGLESDQAFDIIASEDDERNFNDCFLLVYITENKITEFAVLNMYEDFEDIEVPKLTLEEESHIRGLINSSIKASLEVQKEYEELEMSL